MTAAPTFINPTFKKPFPARLKSLLHSHKLDVLKAINCVRVGVVSGFDPGEVNVRAANVDVLIAQTVVTSVSPDGTETIAEYSEIKQVPVWIMGGGGVSSTYPINEGDECVLLFHDRHLDDWFVNGPGLPPAMGRLHDMSDAIALVGIRSGPRALGAWSQTAAQMRTDDGEAYVEVGIDHHITAVTPAGKVINYNGMTIDNGGNVVIPGTLTVNSTIIANGNITGNGISLDTHHHTGVQTGTGNTGGPA